ncbi:DUF6531 domain-containing protein [Clostridium cellulovorans]|uniref:DUF6531 domain-containing protein n=1 Tax=Clostridium cellulovorans TaxID=1493 RepID=UPI0001A969B3|nr:DUF6531 domain-containing protein [Clostridium cellulovorans]
MGYINDYNGNLVFTHNDLSSAGNRLPANIMHVFNSSSRNSDIGYGNGWRLNLNQKVSGPLTFTDGKYYSHIDEDGTTHYYKYDSVSNTYKNTEGLDTTLQVNADSTITDKQNNTLKFNTSGYLSTIKDNNGNIETLNYSGTILKSVTDGAVRISTLDTDTSGRLKGVIDSSNRRTSYEYTGNLLTSISYPDGKQTIYSYNSSNNMVSATNYDGYKVTYSYNTVAPYRIRKAAESNSDGAAGSELNIAYGYNMTSFTDAIGRKNIYQFNNSGNTVSIKDGENSAEYYKYGSSSNKLLSNSKSERTVINYLKNGNAESNADWIPFINFYLWRKCSKFVYL